MFSLHFGNNYTGQAGALKQCHYDARRLRQYLRTRGIKDSKVLLDQGKQSMLNEIRRAIRKANEHKAPCTLWITYSGHGSSIRDTSGDERDGKDEVIIPNDYAQAGVITDDYLAKLFATLKAHVKCYLIMDCCHSGTILDFPYRFGGRSTDRKYLNFAADIVCISACQDYQVAYEVSTGGALTNCLVNFFYAKKGTFTLGELWAELLKVRGQRPHLSATNVIKAGTKVTF